MTARRERGNMRNKMNWMHESLFLIFHANEDASHVKTCSLNFHFSVVTVAEVTAVEAKAIVVAAEVAGVLILNNLNNGSGNRRSRSSRRVAAVVVEVETVVAAGLAVEVTVTEVVVV